MRSSTKVVLNINSRFHDRLCRLGLKARATGLIDKTRVELAHEFFERMHIYITHPVQRNLFLSSCAMTFLASDRFTVFVDA